MERFSVLLSLYSKEDPGLLYQSLSSIFVQSVSPDEVILVKDGPLTNALDEIIEEFDINKLQLVTVDFVS